MFQQQQWILYNERERKNFLRRQSRGAMLNVWGEFFFFFMMPLNLALLSTSLTIFSPALAFLHWLSCLRFFSAAVLCSRASREKSFSCMSGRASSYLRQNDFNDLIEDEF